MSNLHPHHPEEAVLVRWVDGELAPAEARDVEQHLEACRPCRQEVEEVQAALAECISYRHDVLDSLLPPPPEPWADLRPEFARIDRSLGPASEARWWSLGAWSLRPALGWALAAALAVAGVVWYQFRETPSVEAASLLHRAEAAAARTSAPFRRVRIRTKTAQVTRLIARKGAPNLPKEPAAPGLQALFQAARWDWNDPLSAQAFADWRGLLQEKKDSVTSTADSYQIRTATPDGELAAASLTLRAADLEPTEARLEFRNQDWVELSEVAEGTAEDDGSTVALHGVEPPARRAEPSRPAAEPSGGTASISGELRVLAALHGIGADLGETVEVTRDGGRWVVSGVGIAPARQRQIQSALDGIPNVAVQFSEPGALPPPTEPPAAVAAPPEIPAGGAMAARVEHQLGGRPQFERFSSQMLDWNEAAMAHAYAIKRLAERFPPLAEATLSASDRGILRGIARENTTALADVAAKMRRTLEPVLTTLGGRAAGRAPVADAWQPTAEDLVRTAQRVELRLSVMLGAAPGDGTAFSASELLGDLGHLEDDIAHCQRLLAQE